MILGIGIDVVHADRLLRWQRVPGLLERFFHHDELTQCRAKGAAGVLSMAARFSAKEAFGKAMGTGLAGLTLVDMAVMNDALGKPEFRLEGSALAAFERVGGTRVFVSLSHERSFALAMVVIEGDDTRRLS